MFPNLCKIWNTWNTPSTHSATSNHPRSKNQCHWVSQEERSLTIDTSSSQGRSPSQSSGTSPGSAVAHWSTNSGKYTDNLLQLSVNLKLPVRLSIIVIVNCIGKTRVSTSVFVIGCQKINPLCCSSFHDHQFTSDVFHLLQHFLHAPIFLEAALLQRGILLARCQQSSSCTLWYIENIANCEVECIVRAKQHLSHLKRLDKVSIRNSHSRSDWSWGWSCSNQVDQIVVTVREVENQWKRSARRFLA